jgi:thymidylate synthase
MKLIACLAKNRGIGMEGKLPWDIKKDMNFFKQKTTKCNVIMGYKTWESLSFKPLQGRYNIVLTNKKINSSYQNTIFTDFDNLKNVMETTPYKETFVIGGQSIYEHFLAEGLITEMYITQLENDVKCDTFFPRVPSVFEISSVSEKIKENDYSFRFIHLKRSDKVSSENEYLKLGSHILKNGSSPRVDRTKIGTTSIFGHQMRFDISKNVPLMTTKRVPWKTCIEELLWFLRGETDAKILQNKGITIWNGNTSREFLDNMGFYDVPEGELRYGYGHQIRRFGPKKVDQLMYVENLLKTDPYSRRIMWNLWNANDLDEMVLTPCHNQVQFYVDDGKLSCHLYIRSSDFFLGLPFNIFSYTVLTYILAKRCSLEPYELIVSSGDTHIYMNHIQQVKEQLSRNTMVLPVLEISEDIITKDYCEISIDDFDIIFYHPMPTIKGLMAI